MQINITQADFFEWITSRHNCELEISGEKYLFNPKRLFSNTTFSFDKLYLHELFIRANLVDFENLVSVSGAYFECLVELKSDRYRTQAIMDRVNGITDPQQKFDYKIDKPGDLFCLLIISNMMKLRRVMASPVYQMRNRQAEIDRIIENEEALAEIVTAYVRNPYTLKIEAKEGSSKASMFRLFDSLRFHLAYNLGISIVNLDTLTPFRAW